MQQCVIMNKDIKTKTLLSIIQCREDVLTFSWSTCHLCLAVLLLFFLTDCYFYVLLMLYLVEPVSLSALNVTMHPVYVPALNWTTAWPILIHSFWFQCDFAPFPALSPKWPCFWLSFERLHLTSESTKKTYCLFSTTEYKVQPLILNQKWFSL